MYDADEPRWQLRQRAIDTGEGLYVIVSPPGAIESQDCPTCGQGMTVTRDVKPSFGLVQGLAGRTVRHDEFYCENSAQAWHIKARALQNEADATHSDRVRSLIRADWLAVIQANRPDLAEALANRKEQSDGNG